MIALPPGVEGLVGEARPGCAEEAWEEPKQQKSSIRKGQMLAGEVAPLGDGSPRAPKGQATRTTGVVACTWNPGPRQAEAGGSEIQAHSLLQSESEVSVGHVKPCLRREHR